MSRAVVRQGRGGPVSPQLTVSLRFLAKRLLLSLALLSITRAPVQGQELEISLAHDSAREQATRAQLGRILSSHDLGPWIFTRSLVIDDRAIPHSHPVLTLHTRHLKDDELLLSTFVHEQLHWFVSQKLGPANAAVEELQQLFPQVPVGYPEGSNDERGNYTHLIIIPLEYRAARSLLGELRARQVMEFWATDHYTWLYRTVLDRGAEIVRILHKNDLVPSG